MLKRLKWVPCRPIEYFCWKVIENSYSLYHKSILTWCIPITFNKIHNPQISQFQWQSTRNHQFKFITHNSALKVLTLACQWCVFYISWRARTSGVMIIYTAFSRCFAGILLITWVHTLIVDASLFWRTLWIGSTTQKHARNFRIAWQARWTFTNSTVIGSMAHCSTATRTSIWCTYWYTVMVHTGMLAWTVAVTPAAHCNSNMVPHFFIWVRRNVVQQWVEVNFICDKRGTLHPEV